jgi:hypothetical protein
MSTIKITLILTFSLFYLNLSAQTYQLTVDSKPFVYLENPLVAVDGPWWDGTWWPSEFQLPIGFDFELFDFTSDSIYPNIYSEGGVFNLNLDYDHLYMIMPFYAPLIDRGYQQDSALSPIHYKTEGMLGQQVFTLEFKEAGLFEGLETDDGVFLDHVSFQVRLYEETGDIEFHYGPYVTKEDPEVIFGSLPGPLVGLLADADWDTPGGNVAEVILLEGDPLAPSVFTGSGPTTLVGSIPENTVYRFSRMGTSVGEDLDPTKPPFLFPNPTSGFIQLNANNATDVNFPIIVFDIYGKQAGFWRNADEISASGFAAGCYHVIFHSKENIFTEKLIVFPE